MANKDELIAAIDKFILIDYGMWQYGGVPFIPTTAAAVDEVLPADMKFTEADLAEVANYCAQKYVGYYTYDEWYSQLKIGLSGRLTEAPAPEPISPVTASILSKPVLILGGVFLLIYLLGRRGEKAEG